MIAFDNYFLDNTYHSHLKCVCVMENTVVVDSIKVFVGSGFFVSLIRVICVFML